MPALGLDYRPGSVELGGGLKAPLLAREGGADPSRESGLTESALAVEVVPSAYGFYNLRPAHLALGASAYAVYFAVDEVRARGRPAARSASRSSARGGARRAGRNAPRRRGAAGARRARGANKAAHSAESSTGRPRAG